MNVITPAIVNFAKRVTPATSTTADTSTTPTTDSTTVYTYTSQSNAPEPRAVRVSLPD